MANIIIQQIADATRNLLSLPYNASPDKISKKIKYTMGITVLYTNNTSFDGCLKWNTSLKRPEIIISIKDSYYRKKFTLAHELGHLLLHWKWHPGNDLTSEVKYKSNSVLDTYHPTMFRDLISTIINPQQKEKENQANEFAANLLMPTKVVQQVYTQSFSHNLDYVKYDVSAEFDVSTDAAYHRLKNLKKRDEL